jgi:WD40 repeat protein
MKKFFFLVLFYCTPLVYASGEKHMLEDLEGPQVKKVRSEQTPSLDMLLQQRAQRIHHIATALTQLQSQYTYLGQRIASMSQESTVPLIPTEKEQLSSAQPPIIDLTDMTDSSNDSSSSAVDEQPPLLLKTFYPRPDNADAASPFKKRFTDTLNKSYILLFRYIPQARALFTYYNDETIRIWDLATGMCIQTFKNPTGNPLLDACASPYNPNNYVVSTQHAIYLIRSDRVLLTIKDPQAQAATTLYVSNWPWDREYLYSGHKNGTIQQWSLKTGRHMREITLFKEQSSIFSMCMTQEKCLVATQLKGKVSAKQLTTKKAASVLPIPDESLVRLHPIDSNKVIIAGEDIRVISLSKKLQECSVIKPSDEVTSILTHPDNTHHILVGLKNGVIELWDIENKLCKAHWQAHKGAVIGLALDTTLISAGEDGLINLWKFKNITSSKRKIPASSARLAIAF